MVVRRQRLAQRRKALGFSQERLADRLGIDRSTVARWEAGQTEPLPWLRPKLARVLKLSLEQVDGLLADVGGPDASIRDRLSYALAHPASTDLVAIAHIRERLQRLDQLYDRAPSTSLLPDAAQCLDQVSFLRAHATGNRTVRELLAVEAEAATLMGQLVWDASQRRAHAAARAYFDQAMVAARELPDTSAEALALLRTCFLALYGERRPTVGLSLARRTAEMANSRSRVLTGLALLHAAEAHAMLGERRECEQALASAETQFGDVTSTDAAIEMYSPTQQGRLAGSCYLFLKDPKRAEHLLHETSREMSDGSKSHAILLGNLAIARIRQRKLDEAAATLHRAIAIVENTRGGGGLNVVFAAGRELRQWRHIAQVHDVQDRLLALMAET